LHETLRDLQWSGRRGRSATRTQLSFLQTPADFLAAIYQMALELRAKVEFRDAAQRAEKRCQIFCAQKIQGKLSEKISTTRCDE
jgi:hypothetical protein